MIIKKGKEKGISYKDAIINVIEKEIDNNRWGTVVNDSLLKSSFAKWNNLLSNK